MPDVQAGQSTVAQAQELGADVLAKLDRLVQQSEAAQAVSQADLESRKQFAKEAIDKMNAIVEGFIATTNAKHVASQQEQAALDQAEIERLKASVGATT